MLTSIQYRETGLASTTFLHMKRMQTLARDKICFECARFEFESSRTFPGPFAKNGSFVRTFPGQNKIPGHFQDFQDEWPPCYKIGIGPDLFKSFIF